MWYCFGLCAFPKWLLQEASTPDCLATFSDVEAWLRSNGVSIRLRSASVREHAKDILSVLGPIQVSVASTHGVTPKKRRPKPHMHRVYNGMHALYVKLRVRVDTKSSGPSTEAQSEHKNAAGQYVHQQRQRIRTDFLDAVCTAVCKL